MGGVRQTRARQPLAEKPPFPPQKSELFARGLQSVDVSPPDYVRGQDVRSREIRSLLDPKRSAVRLPDPAGVAITTDRFGDEGARPRFRARLVERHRPEPAEGVGRNGVAIFSSPSRASAVRAAAAPPKTAARRPYLWRAAIRVTSSSVSKGAVNATGPNTSSRMPSMSSDASRTIVGWMRSP